MTDATLKGNHHGFLGVTTGGGLGGVMGVVGGAVMGLVGVAPGLGMAAGKVVCTSLNLSGAGGFLFGMAASVCTESSTSFFRVTYS